MTNFYRLFKKIPRYFLLLACAMKFCGRQLKEYRILLRYPALLMLILPMYELLCKMPAPRLGALVLGEGNRARKMPRAPRLILRLLTFLLTVRAAFFLPLPAVRT